MKKRIILLLVSCTSYLGAEVNVLAFAGSTREDSLNKKLIAEAAKVAKSIGAKVTVVDLKDFSMPFYNADLEAKEKMPAAARRLRQLMVNSQVILIATPEYNASVPAVLKNALDWTSRAEEGGSSRAAFQDKKFILLSASPGQTGGARALVHLRAIVQDVGGKPMAQQVSVPNAYSAFDAQGNLVDPKLRNDLAQVVRQAVGQ